MSRIEKEWNKLLDSAPGTQLRRLVQDATLQVPGAPFALCAPLAEQAGYSAVYLSGAGFSAAALALPDTGLFSLDELVVQAERLCRASNLPVIVDADTGFGKISECVAQLEAAGVAAIQLEDQTFPKRCGHLEGKQVVPVEEMCQKIASAATARQNKDLILIGRTDARATDGLDAAIDRAARYLEAGADWIFPEALKSREEFTQFAAAIDAPLIANMTEFGAGPLLTHQELTELGFAVVLYPVTLLRVAMKAIETALAFIDDAGTQEELLDLMQTRNELYELLDYDPSAPSE
ncbi:MAG: isocitrate lyase/phosphoenolpyruvate mutase family protein [Pirellulales bacterium]|nr:isocitrate lyase/phosphoenolpyruvate mutase family protein [Pirellulales bacterium]